MICSASWTVTLHVSSDQSTAYTHINSMSQGTNDLPAQSTIFRNPARMGRPKTATRTQVLIWSMIHSFLVDLLKPCFSSRTKV